MTDNVIQFLPWQTQRKYWTAPPAHMHTMTNSDGSWSYMGPHYNAYIQPDTAPSEYVAPSDDCA